MKRILILCALLIPIPLRAEQQTFLQRSGAKVVEFSLDSAKKLPKFMGDTRCADVAREKRSDSHGAYINDLNGDGKQDYVVDCDCGNHECGFAIYDGKTNQQVGRFDGTWFYLLGTKINGWPVVGLDNILHAEHVRRTFVFDGKEYIEVASVDIGNRDPAGELMKLEKIH